MNPFELRKPAFSQCSSYYGLFVALVWLLLVLLPGTVEAAVSRPNPEAGPTEVVVDIYILDIDEVNTANQSYDANVFIGLNWKDPRLAHQGAGSVFYRPTEIWSPSVQIVNQQRTWKTFADQLEVLPDGTVYYSQRHWGSFSQPLKLRDFPFDRQAFNIQLMDINYSPKEVAFVAGEYNGIAEQLSVADWVVTGFETSVEPFTITAADDQFASYKAMVTAKRKSGYFLVKVILPLILIVMMSWIVFWINPQEGSTQISVAITSMLTLIAYRFAVGADMPKISYLTRLDFLILGGTILVFASLIEVLITSTYAKIGKVKRARQIDYWARGIFPLSFILLLVLSLGGGF